MIPWLLDVLERAQREAFTGRLHCNFHNGRLKHVLRAVLPVDPAHGEAPPDAGEVLERWEREGLTGDVDLYLLAGAVVEIHQADLLVPPATPRLHDYACPQCGASPLMFSGDYGNAARCPKCGKVWTKVALRELRRAAEAALQDDRHVGGL